MQFSFSVSNLVRKIQGLAHGGKDPLIGIELGPPGQEVKIIKELGAGSMGTVYKACQGSLERPVAVKFLARGYKMDDPDSAKRFYNEARAMAQLRSPHIVHVYFVGHYLDLPYLVMEYLDGYNLETYLRMHERLETEEALELMRQVLKGLAQAHERGKVHRDIKPANIMVTGNRTAVILDFGLVRDSEGTRVTLEDEILGTPLYVAPEQIEGNETDERVDLYAVGIILYELITGHAPYDGKDYIEVLKQHIEEPLPHPEKFGVSIDPCIMGVIQGLTAKNPDERFSSAREAIQAIDRQRKRLQAGVPCHEAPQPMPPREQHIGVAVNRRGQVTTKLGDIEDRYATSLHLLNTIMNEFKALEPLGEFSRGRLTTEDTHVLVIPHGSGLAGLKCTCNHRLSELNQKEYEALAECFEEQEA